MWLRAETFGWPHDSRQQRPCERRGVPPPRRHAGDAGAVRRASRAAPCAGPRTSGAMPMNLGCSLAFLLLTVAVAVADVFSYECDVLPADAGWSLIQAFCDPEEWIEHEQLFQRVD